MSATDLSPADSAINTQPTIVRNAWNWTLQYVAVTYLLHSWELTSLPCSVTSSAHRVPIYSVNRSLPETAARLRLLENAGQSFKPITFPVEVQVQSEEEYLAAMARRGPREPSN